MRTELLIGWHLPGGPRTFGNTFEAAGLRDVGGKVVIRVPNRSGYAPPDQEWYVWHSNSPGSSDAPWHVSQRVIVGSRGAVESDAVLEAFSRFSEAMAYAKKCAIAAAAKANGEPSKAVKKFDGNALVVAERDLLEAALAEADHLVGLAGEGNLPKDDWNEADHALVAAAKKYRAAVRALMRYRKSTGMR